jgi:hypothetical protein
MERRSFKCAKLKTKRGVNTRRSYKGNQRSVRRSKSENAMGMSKNILV